MTNFNYELEHIVAGMYYIRARVAGDAPACAQAMDNVIVGWAIDMGTPNPGLILGRPIGIDGVEKICALMRNWAVWSGVERAETEELS
jgi:hypothetical protein